jgi:predicted DCC family thiol-disulfide oxidoreductase YuxK
LVYDGECGFCGYWARYWQKLTGDSVDYRPYQEVAAHYPSIPVSDFQRAVQYLSPDGRRANAAEASFLTLSHARGKGLWLALYRRLPGFAPISERVYAFTAAHRPAFYRLSLLLWGKNYAPPRYELVSSLFLRLFGLIYLSAFVSFGVQAKGLIGSEGILPLRELVETIGRSAGAERFFLMPMVFWWNASDAAIQSVCWVGAGLALLVFFSRLTRLALAALFVLYLSLLYGGQEFMTYQWDTFLLESGFVALLMSFARTPGIWLLRWLLFRFMFMSGVVKLLSGDPNWWNLSALSYHFLTQPLPTPIAWHAAQLSARVLRGATGAMFVVELVLPFLIFCPRRLRFLAAFGILLLQGCILITGNYNWFNLQTMLLCLVLFDDAALQSVLPGRLIRLLTPSGQLSTPTRQLPTPTGQLPTSSGQLQSPSARLSRPRASTAARVVRALALLLVFCSLVQMDLRFGGSPPTALRAVAGVIEPLHLVSAYGLFAVMTTERNEIVIEGSSDGIEWREYEFRYKPGDLARGPPWNIPHQPRLDWQMWFAALDDPRRLRWFWAFLRRLLENDPAVTALLRKNPFPDRPPVYVRAQFYEYTYSNPQEKARGLWWQRRPLGLYFPVASLRHE